MQKGRDSANRLADWGDSLLNQLPSRTRKRRKRSASKRRRLLERAEVRAGSAGE
jgi:hypothetical protein